MLSGGVMDALSCCDNTQLERFRNVPLCVPERHAVGPMGILRRQPGLMPPLVFSAPIRHVDPDLFTGR